MRGLLFILLITATVVAQDLPVAAKLPVTDEYHGVKVVDDYRWLEDSKSAETKKWLAAVTASAKYLASWVIFIGNPGSNRVTRS